MTAIPAETPKTQRELRDFLRANLTSALTYHLLFVPEGGKVVTIAGVPLRITASKAGSCGKHTGEVIG